MSENNVVKFAKYEEPLPDVILRHREGYAEHGPKESCDLLDRVTLEMGNQAAEIERLTRERDEMRAAIMSLADRLERTAFEMPAPNGYTPRLVMLAIGMRDAALAPPTDGAERSQERNEHV